jgi:hypothetical protein
MEEGSLVGKKTSTLVSHTLGDGRGSLLKIGDILNNPLRSELLLG